MKNYYPSLAIGGCLLLSAGLSGCGSRSINNDAPTPNSRLNDTGIIACSALDTSVVANPCPQEALPGQDAEYGRDSLYAQGKLTKVGAGAAGFDFTKLDKSGVPLAIQNTNWEPANGTEAQGTRWSCVQDHVTGLMWEVKESLEDHPRYGGHSYTWFEESPTVNGGNAGVENNGVCSTSNCDTQGYRTWVNQQGLCGHNDWRLPTTSELLSIAHTTNSGMAIDADFFPNTLKPRFYTRNTHARDPMLAWYVYFTDASMSFTNKFDPSHVRLVRGGQL
ncbi:MAG TPA: DUF1566 domain-containing protein [Marinagarivorans sp.]